ncbi:MAG: DMT family transporter [Prosthecobacter sp.]|nr:DMT family transporter [Prosthecobacter sp.]
MQPATATVVYPLIAALVYVFSALLLKRSSDLGVGLWRTTFMVNMIVGASFSLLWLLGGQPVEIGNLWQPAVIALCLFGGQIAQFLALERGDVSVAVPVFGLKVILVAFFTPWITGDVVSLKLWLAAILSVLGVTMLNRKEVGKPPRNLGVTMIAGGIGAVCFAMFDVLVQRWGPAWGVGHLLPCIFWINAVFSLALIPLFRAPLRAIPRAAWPWLVAGTILLGAQSIVFISTIAAYGHATATNIVYAARGLLSVGLVWLIGHWFMNAEQHLGPRVLRFRLFGALMMMSAIVLVVV